MFSTKSVVVWCAMAALWQLSAAARADTVHLVADTDVNLSSANQNNGSGANVYVRNVGAGWTEDTISYLSCASFCEFV
jgi:hypothetical protein